MFALLAADELDGKTLITLYISIGAAILLAAVIVTLCFIDKRLSSRALATAGVTLALSFVLSLFKVAPVTYGGSITLASMLPIMIFAYFYGFAPALLTGVVFGLLQFISSPYDVLHPLTFFLDYVLAFSCIAIVPLFKKVIKNKTWSFVVGITAAYVFRFIMHVTSGIIYFNLGAIWAELPANTAITYSLLYNVIYLLPDYVITAIFGVILSATKALEKIQAYAVK